MARLIFILIFLTPFACSQAQDLPQWEIGLGFAGLNLPYYRGADQSKTYLLPLPYITYRGDRLKIDDAGIHGHIFKTDRAKFDLSVSGGVPVPKDGGGARMGMPSLAPTLELGPSLEVQLWKSPHAGQSAWLRMPLRAALAVDSPEISHQGWVFAPYLEYLFSEKANYTWSKTSVSVGPLYADSGYHDYFYGVAPIYATAARPEYHAQAGYSGSRITLTWQRRVGKLWAGAFARYDNLAGAVIDDSPLLRTEEYHAVGFGITWIIAESKKSVSAAP